MTLTSGLHHGLPGRESLVAARVLWKPHGF